MNDTKTTNRKGETMKTATMIPNSNAIQYPSGRWGFVGRVSAALAYVQLDGSPATEEQLATAAQFGPRLAHITTRTFATKAEALHAAADLDS